jgi:hypothetical protein
MHDDLGMATARRSQQKKTALAPRQPEYCTTRHYNLLFRGLQVAKTGAEQVPISQGTAKKVAKLRMSQMTPKNSVKRYPAKSSARIRKEFRILA